MTSVFKIRELVFFSSSTTGSGFQRLPMNILACSFIECLLNNPQGKSLLNSSQVLFHTIISLCYDKNINLPIILETTKQILKISVGKC